MIRKVREGVQSSDGVDPAGLVLRIDQCMSVWS